MEFTEGTFMEERQKSETFILGALQYIFPVVAFALGILAAEQIGYKFKDSIKIHWRQIVLLIEIIVLTAVAFIPHSFDMLANVMVSFSCAMQVQAFRTVKGHSYSSTMCIGNLRSGTESLSMFIRSKDKADLINTLYYYGIILIFAIGAGLGGILSMYLGYKTILISGLILTISFLLMNEKK